MQKITHKKGIHFGFPFRFPQKTKLPISFEFEFTEESKYKVPNNNQGDWNKMFGIKSGLFSQLKDGVMVGWRYDDVKDKFFVCLYVHGGKAGRKNLANFIKVTGHAVGSGNAFVSDYEFECSVGEKISGRLYNNITNGVTLNLVKLDLPSVYIRLDRNDTYSSGWRIFPWFGGQETSNCSFNLRI